MTPFGQRWNALLLTGIVRCERRGRPQRWRCLRETLSVRCEKSVGADEYESAVSNLDVPDRRSKFGDLLQDLRMPDRGGGVPRRDCASVRHDAQSDEHGDRHTESELQPSAEPELNR